MRATLITDNRMNLIENHCACGFEHPTSTITCQQNVERFRCRYDYMRRSLRHRRTLRRGRVARAHESPDVHFGKTHCSELFADPFEWELKITLDVVAESFER